MESTKNPEKQFSFGDYVLWFPKGNKSHLGKFTRKWFGLYRVHYVLPNNNVLLVTIEKFKANPMLVNVNKCEYLLHTFTTKVCTHIKPGWKWNYYVVVV